jgi:hypothetical protein
MPLKAWRASLVVLAGSVLTLGSVLSASGAAALPTRWSIVPSSNVSPSQGSNLLGTSCTSTTFCMSVGHYTNASGIDQTLTETFNGSSWSIVPSPDTSPTLDNDLGQVSCTSPNFCVAVGDAKNSGFYYQPLVEMFDGTSWSIIPSPSTSTTEAQFLNGVTCLGTTFCVAVGAVEVTAGHPQTLVLSYDGTQWVITPSPSPSPSIDILGAVSCPSITDCVAVGVNFNEMAGHGETLIESFDGAKWMVTPSPNVPGSQDNTVYGISCTSISDCVAVGSYADASYVNHTLTLAYDGINWTIEPSPNTSSDQDNVLQSVSCTSSTSCMAVGSTGKPAPVEQTLVEDLTETAWGIVPSPNTSPNEDNVLSDVTCPGAEYCVAVGNSSVTGGNARTLALVGTVPAPPIPRYRNVPCHGETLPFWNARF